MKYAVIKTGGKQYKVSEGNVIEIEQLGKNPADEISFSEVMLFVGEDGKAQIGKPFIDGFSVNGTILGHKRSEKITVSKFKAKSKYRRTIGHRHKLSQVKIEQIPSTKKSTQDKATEKPVSSEQNKKPARARRSAAKK